MVINIGALKDGDDALVEETFELSSKQQLAKLFVKVIIEASLLTDEEKVRACQLSMKAGADFVKTFYRVLNRRGNGSRCSAYAQHSWR